MVKKGYKQTEIGLVPEDWSVSVFGSKAKIYRGGSPRPIQDYLTQAEDGINWIKIGDVREADKFITSTEEKIIPEGVSRSRPVHVGDFILSNSMSFGRPYILSIDGCIHDGWLAIQEYEKTFSKSFLYYLLSSDSVYQQYISMAAGSSVKNLNKEKVSSLVVAYPDIGEQERIADTLSNMDSLIATLEKQISKKKAIKQGAMQELLTGKKRLPGFSDEWEKHSFYGVCDISARMVDPTQSEYENYPHIGNESIEKFSGRITHYNKVKEDQLISGKYIFTENDVLYGKINPQFAKATFPRFKGLCSADMYPITCKDQIIPEYLLYILLSSDFTSYTVSLSKRSGIPKVNRDELAEYPMLLPSVEEQRAISDVLIGMDAEVEMLIQKLRRYRQVKQGMMQQLLTGKIRLV